MIGAIAAALIGEVAIAALLGLVLLGVDLRSRRRRARRLLP